MCWCVVETVLSTIVFVYMMTGAGATINDTGAGGLGIGELCNLSSGMVVGYLLGIILPPYALVCTGCAVGSVAWTGVSHCLCASRVMAAVDNNIESIDEGGTHRVNFGRCSVNFFEYHDVVTIGLRISKVALLWSVFLVFGFLPVFGVVDQYLTNSNDTWSILNILTLLWMAMYWVLFTGLLVVATFLVLKSGVKYFTQPFHSRARVLLLVSTIMFAVLLWVSPAPSTWRWALLAVHTIRVSSVFASLLGQIGVVEGTTGRTGDML